ncbi:hypothetical protein DBR32_14520 [Taibaiella sp. KBW10]|uniref:DUF2911 domain-containing protein n=1 Tax=Taibaiella sp. KBW10 TaxID=2153357 RepID=UPI000F5B2118|nr:DUF2911 domain-containing protein [Taibaiella sp. KBW10]RQO29795.1 hypothetical protein DBR32_14520 [Taibaiella sp. KBW10]
MKKISLALAMGLLVATSSFAQEFKMPAPSPTATLSQDFSTSKIDISYSRPSVKGRKIFGDIVPFGQEWRTGANGATKVTFGEDVFITGKLLKAGTYSLYTIPGKESWEVIFNESTENWGLSGYDKKKNVLSVKLPAMQTNVIETFSITVEDITKNTCNIVLAWEKARVAIPVKVENEARIEAYIEKSLKGENPPYMVAAKYYLEQGKNLNEALGYTDKAIQANPKAFYIHWMKAQILEKLGKKKEAIAEAKVAADGAKGSPYEAEYANNYKEISK